MDTEHYKLDRLIAIERQCTRYEATLSDGRSAEVRLLHFREMLHGEDDWEAARQWLQTRLACIQIVAWPHARAVLLNGTEQAAPFVALSPFEMSCRSTLKQSPDPTSLLSSLVSTCIETMAACHRTGLVIGGFNGQVVTYSAVRGWSIDLTGLISAFNSKPSQLQTSESGYPPELKTSGNSDPRLDFDAASDVYCFGKWLMDDVLASVDTTEPFKAAVRSVFAAALCDDPTERPTAAELRQSWSRASEDLKRSLGESVTIYSPESSSQSLSNSDQRATQAQDETLNVDIEISTSDVVNLDPGTTVGRYVVEQKVGAGGMGSVYRATDPIDRSLVAIKVMNRKDAENPVLARRFVKESRMLARVNNPYIARLLDVSTEGAVPYMAMEYVEGGTLKSLIEHVPPLPHRLLMTFFLDAVRGLAHAHSRGMVHRDFKPDNILLTRAAAQWLADLNQTSASENSVPPPGVVYAKVTDFGLARTSQQSESLAVTRIGALLGTPMYMSPEQCRGEGATAASDVYSVGVTMFQLLAGVLPFEAESHAAILHKHCNEAPPSLKQFRSQLPDVLVSIVERCLAKNPDARYRDAIELQADIDNFLSGKPSSLALHPPVLSLQGPNVLEFNHSWDLESSPAALWPYLSNTDRVNHAIGLPAVQYTVRNDSESGVQRIAEATVAGQKIRWLEHPYEWIEGKRLSVLREFTHGPFVWFANIVELNPRTGGGTQVSQRLLVQPKNWLGKQIARIQLGNKSKQNFGKIYSQVDDYLQSNQQASADVDPFTGRTELKPGNRSKLNARIDELRNCAIDPRIVEAVGQYLEFASDVEVARIRPVELARRLNLDEQQVINACLHGTRIGLMTLMWDLLCPTCRIPSSVQETLANIKDHGYCEACDLRYQLDLNSSVEMIFRAHPEIRPVETRVYCIGGPAWSKHVVAQVRLANGERFACELNLEPGSYILRGPKLPFVIDLRVGGGLGVTRVDLALGRPPLESDAIRLGPGPQVIYLLNDSGQDQQVRIERTASKGDAVSAAQASTMALFRELFPDEVLANGQIVSLTHITLMLVQLPDAYKLYESLGDAEAFSRIRSRLESILEMVKSVNGAVVKTIGEGVLAAFSDSSRAIKCAHKLSASDPADLLAATVAIHSGPVMAATLDDRLDYFGRTLQVLNDLMQRASKGSIVVTSALTEQPNIAGLLDELQWSVDLFYQSDLVYHSLVKRKI